MEFLRATDIDGKRHIINLWQVERVFEDTALKTTKIWDSVITEEVPVTKIQLASGAVIITETKFEDASKIIDELEQMTL